MYCGAVVTMVSIKKQIAARPPATNWNHARGCRGERRNATRQAKKTKQLPVRATTATNRSGLANCPVFSGSASSCRPSSTNPVTNRLTEFQNPLLKHPAPKPQGLFRCASPTTAT